MRGAPTPEGGALSTLTDRAPAWVRDPRLRTGIAALLVVLLLLGVGALLGGWRPFSRSVDVVTFGADGDIARFTLFDGQCAVGSFSEPAGFPAETDTACGTPHDVEAVGSIDTLGEGRPVSYPGADELAAYGRAFCRMLVDSALVADTAGDVPKSDLRVTAVVPGRAAFESPRTDDAGTAGARQVVCVVSRSDGGKLGDRYSVV